MTLERFQSANNPGLAAKLNAIIDQVEILGRELGGPHSQITGVIGASVFDVSEPLLTPNIPRPYSDIHVAFCSEDSGAGNTIDAFLDIDTDGQAITVTCSIAAGGTDLNEATPRLAEGDEIYVKNFSGTWKCIQTFMFTEVCVCS